MDKQHLLLRQFGEEAPVVVAPEAEEELQAVPEQEEDHLPPAQVAEAVQVLLIPKLLRLQEVIPHLSTQQRTLPLKIRLIRKRKRIRL